MRKSLIDFNFERKERLKKKNDIREVFEKGKHIGCRGAKLFILENHLPYNRICFSFSRGFSAVQRNREKRLGREAFRTMKHVLRQGYDLILLEYSEAAVSKNKTFQKETPCVKERPTLKGRAEQMKYLFSKASLLQ